jgi:uncharacterized GH25 family protein
MMPRCLSHTLCRPFPSARPSSVAKRPLDQSTCVGRWNGGRLLFTTAFTFAALLPLHADAHDFWIDARPGTVSEGGTVIVDLKVGVMLKGESYPFLSDNFATFTGTVRGETQTVTGLEGDIPAASIANLERGLHVLAVQTVPFRATYDEWEPFERYTREEGLVGIADMHRARGLPETGFAERYIRYAKALVQVGPASDEDVDVRTGMQFELFAEANPYDGIREVLNVTLLWRGMPAPGHQISVYHQNGDVKRKNVVTDESGRALVRLSGEGSYLLNSVHIEPYEAPPVVWQSHWASLSFSIDAMRQ